MVLSFTEISDQVFDTGQDNPVIFFEYLNGDFKAVNAYMKSVLASGLSLSEIRTLIMTGRGTKSRRVISNALLNGHVNIGKAFFQNVLRSPLSIDEKIELLHLDDEHGVSEWKRVPASVKNQLLQETMQDMQAELPTHAQVEILKAMCRR